MKTIGEIRCNIDNLKTEQTKLEEACMFTIKALYAK